MSATGAGYDLSPTTFSPDGRVFQVEYAGKAVEKSGTAIGIRCVDGVVLGVEKIIISKMLVRGSNRRICTVDEHAGLAMCGLAADARQLVNKARSEASEYRSFFGSRISGQVLADRLAGHVHSHTLYWYLRPFGASVLLGSYEKKKADSKSEGKGEEKGDDRKDTPVGNADLFMIEPNGICYKYFACAIGKHRQGAKTELEKINFKTVTCRQAVNEIAAIIYRLHDDVKDKAFELELSWSCDESEGRHVLVPDNLVQDAIKSALDAKKKAEEESDDEEMTPAEKAKLETKPADPAPKPAS